MHFTLPEDNLHNAFNAFDLILTSEPQNPSGDAGEELKLHIANSTWGQKDYYFIPAFLDTLALYYGAGINLVDFISDPNACRLIINEWVSRETEERIQDLLPPGSISTLTRLVLANAIYFKANWLYPFDESYTKDGPFTLLDGTNVTAPLMFQSTTTQYYEVPGEFSAVKLPYQGEKKNSMIIILPEVGNFETFENNFTNQTLTAIIQGLARYRVELTLPRFDYEWEDSFKGILKSLGMEDAFTPYVADFSGIDGTKDLYISDVLHKAFIAVDEIGTEAAAATAIIIDIVSMPPLAVMTIDRPFLFVIRNDDTGAILFLGRVLAP